jgi:hypothetical protein
MMIDILTTIQAAAVIQAPSPVITDIREDAFLEVAPPDQAITPPSRPSSLSCSQHESHLPRGRSLSRRRGSSVR